MIAKVCCVLIADVSCAAIGIVSCSESVRAVQRLVLRAVQ
jgi:hypothetical protein